MTTETLSTLADTDDHDIEYPPAELDLSHIVTGAELATEYARVAAEQTQRAEHNWQNWRPSCVVCAEHDDAASA